MSKDDSTESTTVDRNAHRVDEEPSLTSLEPSHEIDQTASSFLSIESTLTEASGVEPGTYAQVTDAARVDASAVPADYPRKILTKTAVALVLTLPDGRERTAFFDWPRDDDAELSRLLAVLDIPRESFANLYGERVLVTVEDGYVLPVVPQSEPRGSEQGVYGVVGGLLFNLLVLFSLFTGIGNVATAGFVLVFLFVNLIVIPAATSLDAWYLKTYTDWAQGPWFWAFWAAIPMLNVASSAAYLYFRRQANPMGAP